MKYNLKKKAQKFFNLLGPGLITGAADDDPSGITTYVQTGAKFGYGQLWTAVYMLPLMITVQEACARIGLVKGKGITAVVKEYYSPNILYFVVSLVMIANTVNIGADIGAMAAAAELLIPLPFPILMLFFTTIILILEIVTNYRNYARVLKWLSLSLLAYPITAFLVDQPWQEVIFATLVPHVEFSTSFLFIITGVLGTTISPYMFFWQASQEAEEDRAHHLIRGGKPFISKSKLRNMRIDNAAGMIFSELSTWSIILVGATVLHGNGILEIHTAAEAAKALEPLVQDFEHAGYLSKVIFSLGVIGLGLLAVPVLSGSAAYAVSEALNWKASFNLKLQKAHGFYGVITLSTLIGLMINFVGIDPVTALIFAAVLNGIAAVPLLFLIRHIAGNKQIMGVHKSSKISTALLWVAFLAMSSAILGLLSTLIL